MFDTGSDIRPIQEANLWQFAIKYFQISFKSEELLVQMRFMHDTIWTWFKNLDSPVDWFKNA